MLTNSSNTQLPTSAAFGSESQSKTACLLITGKNRQILPKINHCRRLVSTLLSVQTRIEACKVTNSAFCKREFPRQILTKITGKNRHKKQANYRHYQAISGWYQAKLDSRAGALCRSLFFPVNLHKFYQLFAMEAILRGKKKDNREFEGQMA